MEVVKYILFSLNEWLKKFFRFGNSTENVLLFGFELTKILVSSEGYKIISFIFWIFLDSNLEENQ